MTTKSNYIAETSIVRHIYYSEGSTVLLKCESYGWMEWFGPAHTNISYEKTAFNMYGHRETWNVTLYTDWDVIIHTLPHRKRLQVISIKRTDVFDLQIINASISDEGLYYCQDDDYGKPHVWYILKMICK